MSNMRNRDTEPAIKNKDVKTVDINDLPDDARRAVVEQLDRQATTETEKARRLAAIKAAATIRKGTPGRPVPDASEFRPVGSPVEADSAIVVGPPQSVDPKTGKPIDGDGKRSVMKYTDIQWEVEDSTGATHEVR